MKTQQTPKLEIIKNENVLATKITKLFCRLANLGSFGLSFKIRLLSVAFVILK